MTNPQILVRFIPSWEVDPEPPKSPEIVLKEGWIKWEGGECPVPSHQHVFIQLRSGSRMNGFEGMPAKAFRWSHTQSISDIVAYKII